MNHIILDLEWNQGNEQRERQQKEIPFEIIEIGAVKIDDRMEGPWICGSFHEIIKPQVYREMHNMTRQILHMDMEDLREGCSFPEVMDRFLTWCAQPGLEGADLGGPDGRASDASAADCAPAAPCEYVFCTWGTQDLTELQRNMRYYRMEPLGKGPLKFYDVQKLFSIAFEDQKSRRNLEYAVDHLKIPKDGAFHRALSDAYYTAKVLERIKDPKVLQKVSFDTFCLPANRKEEVHIVFDDYAKYISREFEDKAQLLEDREVISTKCYLCRRNLKRKVKWFSPNGKHYYSVSYCNVHGYMKGKIRVRKAENNGVYAVKTLKFISEEEARGIVSRKERSVQMKRMKHRKKSTAPDQRSSDLPEYLS